MSVDWKLLAPHKPVDLGSPLYVVPPLQTTVADWVLAGSSVVLLGGPAGVGKSSELAHAASLLSDERVACFVPLDRWENMRALTPERLLLRLAGRLVQLATQVLNLPVSSTLMESLVAERLGQPTADLLGSVSTMLGLNNDVHGLLNNPVRAHAPGPDHFVSSPRVSLHQAIHEVSRLSGKRITFLIDGLEKVPPGQESSLLFDELASLPDFVDVVLVVGWNATFGMRPDAIVRPGERFCPLRAVEVEGEDGTEFLKDILRRRIGDDGIEAHNAVVVEAAVWSGGMPRTFLQLLADAASYARLSGGDWPSRDNLASAILDQQDSFRRLLMPGDTDAIRTAIDTDGREMEVARKVRLMAHGLLLERSRGRTTVLELHPLARSAVFGASK